MNLLLVTGTGFMHIHHQPSFYSDPQMKNRLLTTCHLHAAHTFTGFCSSCLLERLSAIDSSHPTSLSAELRRSKSHSTNRKPDASFNTEPRRKSCDVRAGKTLSDLFNLDDKRKLAGVSELELELKEINEIELSETVNQNINLNVEVEVAEEEEAPLKTMKEFIDLEFERKKNNSRKDIRGIAGNVASMFTQKLKKLTLKQKNKHQAETKTPSVMNQFHGRRSCDTDPRMSVDVSIDDHRASCDGYLNTRRVKLADDADDEMNTVELFNGEKLLITEKELRDSSNWYPDEFDLNKSHKQRNLRNIWGLMQKSQSKNGCVVVSKGMIEGAKADDGSLAESWQKLRMVANESFTDQHKLSKLEELDVGSRYSSNNLDNGLLRFYLTPLRGNSNRTSKSKSGKSRLKDLQSMARNVL